MEDEVVFAEMPAGEYKKGQILEPEFVPVSSLSPEMQLLLQMQKQMEEQGKRLEALATENAVLKARPDPEESLPGHLAYSNGPMGLGSRAARSVTIETRPVRDNPDDPLWGKKKFNPNEITQRGTRPGA